MITLFNIIFFLPQKNCFYFKFVVISVQAYIHCINTSKTFHFFISNMTNKCVYFHRHLPFKETSWPLCRTILPLGEYFSLFYVDLLIFIVL